MNPVLWFRISAALLLLFAIGHTYGFLTFRPPTAEGQAVWAAMNNTHFTVHNDTFSYGNFYIGFGLSISASQLFFAWLAWYLGALCRHTPQAARNIAAAMVLLQIIGLVLSLRFFAAGPALFSALTTITLALAWSSLRPTAQTWSKRSIDAPPPL